MKQPIAAMDSLQAAEFHYHFNNSDSRHYKSSVSVGGGKTKAAIEYMIAAERANLNFLYVAPTIKLVDQTKKNIEETLKADSRHTRNVHLVHSQSLSDGDTATACALAVVNEAIPNVGALVIVTTATFINILPRLQRKHAWRVVLDEAFSPLTFIEYILGRTDTEAGKRYFDEIFTVETSDNNRVKPAPGKTALVQAIASGDWETAGHRFIPMKGLAQAVMNDALRVELAARHTDKYHFAAWVTPDFFGEFVETIYLSALFEQSILFILWSLHHGVEFKSHPYFDSIIQRDTHSEQGSLVSIGHLLNSEDYASRYVLQKNWATGKASCITVGERVIDKILETVQTYFRKQKYLLQVNRWTGYHDKLKDSLSENTEVIPTVAHGLNDYKKYTCIAALAVTNPEKFQIEWLKGRTGLSEDAIYQAYRIHTVYQACGRTAVREWGNKKPLTFLVLGHADAEFLHKLFVGSKWLGQVGTLPKYRRSRMQDNPEYQKLRKEADRLRKMVQRGTAAQAELDAKRQELTQLKSVHKISNKLFRKTVDV